MPRPHARFFGHRVFAVFAFLATIAQIVVAVAPLIEERDGRMASHVEADGTRTHVTHNDATCAASQARSIHGATEAPSTPLLCAGLAADARIPGAELVVSADLSPQHNPRAPPSLS